MGGKVTFPKMIVTSARRVVTFCGERTLEIRALFWRVVTFPAGIVTSAKTIVTFAGLLALASCQTTSGSFCDIAKPVRPSKQIVSQLSDAEVAQLVAHNRKGQRLCGWQP
jgi:hypothetical protein